jgi:hypothetical protein
MQRYIVTIEGPNFNDIEEIELPRLPADGDLVDTKYGTCIVTGSEQSPESAQFQGKIACKLP